MLRSLSHRGPDATRQVDTDLAVLGATRLAIRGLTDQLNQPFADAESGVIAVCNGEIDNHRELGRWLAERGRPVRQETDVAVIPGLYLEFGEAFANRLVGAFAIAVWDPRTRPYPGARPGRGTPAVLYNEPKRNYFRHRDGRLGLPQSLASEPRSGGAARLSSVRYLSLSGDAFQRNPESRAGRMDPVRHGWVPKNLLALANEETSKQPSSLETFDQTFRKAIRRQTEVDVDFGVFLSGGIDRRWFQRWSAGSSQAPVESLHPAFRGTIFDEGGFAEAVAKQLNMDIATVWVGPENALDGLKSIIRMVGEPLADPAWVPTSLLAHRAARKQDGACGGGCR